MARRILEPLTLSPDDPGIDPGIRALVDFLRKRGFDTWTSCEGERAHERRGAPSRFSSVTPHVTVIPLPGDTLEATRLRLARALLRAGYRDFSTHIDQCHGFSKNRRGSGGYPDQCRVEFFHDGPVKPYVKRQRTRAAS